jgi:hypothetical protein
MQRGEPYFDSKVARENSSNESEPSWFRSSWSKILRAWEPSALAPFAVVCGPDVALDGIVEVEVGVVVDVSDDMPVDGVWGDVATPARAALVLPGVPGVAATPAVPCGSTGCKVRVPAVACDADVSAVASDVVAHAAPAMPKTEIATAATNCLVGAFIRGSFEGVAAQAVEQEGRMQGTCLS